MGEIREHYRDQIERLAQRRNSLPSFSHVRAAITDDVLRELRLKVESATDEIDLDHCKWPMIFGFVESVCDDAISELDEDIEVVLAATAPQRKSSVKNFLNTREGDHPGRWYGGLFEVWAKSTLSRRMTDVQYDVPLLNGRDRDVVARMSACQSCTLSGRVFSFECTVITEDDESRAVWDRFLEAKKGGFSKSLVRPGQFDPPNAKGPSPYYMPLRLYGKFFDKVTKDLDPTRSQCDEEIPNIILVCFAGWGVDSKEPGVDWAMEELFANHPKMPHVGVPEGFTDISLSKWVEFTATNLVAKGKMESDFYIEQSQQIVQAPKRLGGALLFDKTAFSKARMNYHAHQTNAVTHSEMAEIERIMFRPRDYWR